MNSLAIAGIQVQNTIIKYTNSDIKLQESKLKIKILEKTKTLTSNSRNPSSKHLMKNRNLDIKLTASLVSLAC